MNEILFPPRVLSRFAALLADEVGMDALKTILLNAGLPPEWADAARFQQVSPSLAARTYAQLQAAIRLYYGRGARGILLRVGAKLWRALLRDASLVHKARAAFTRALPLSLRRKAALDLLAVMTSGSPGDLSAHTHDLDLLFVDHASPATLDQTHASPVCFVTAGLLRECLFWADGQEHDVEESACRAAGARQCEFKITLEDKS